MDKIVSKLVLGSANFGLDYGLNNQSGKISETELKKILSISECSGIDTIDTAQAYGDSEDRLGAVCQGKNFKLITKIGSEIDPDAIPTSIANLINASCERLNQPQLHAVLLHRPEIVLGAYGNEIIRHLLILKDQNVVENIGVSIYSPEILEDLVKVMPIDIVQVPFNIFDQQILASGWHQMLKENETQIHARSAFLQGLLLMQKTKLATYFTDRWPNLFQLWHEFLSDQETDASNAALSFVLRQSWIDKVVVGVDSVAHLKALLEIEKSPSIFDYPEFACADENLINPSNWGLK